MDLESKTKLWNHLSINPNIFQLIETKKRKSKNKIRTTKDFNCNNGNKLKEKTDNNNKTTTNHKDSSNFPSCVSLNNKNFSIPFSLTSNSDFSTFLANKPPICTKRVKALKRLEQKREKNNCNENNTLNNSSVRDSLQENENNLEKKKSKNYIFQRVSKATINKPMFKSRTESIKKDLIDKKKKPK